MKIKMATGVLRGVITAMFIGALPMSAQAQTGPIHIQWQACENMPAVTDRQVQIPSPTLVSQGLPYTVPAGYRLDLGTLQLSDKFGGGVASYLVLLGVTSVPSTTGAFTYNPAFRLPAGFNLDVHLINNNNASQWMCLTITGTLVPV